MVGWLEWVEGGGRPSLGVWGRACERDEGIGDRNGVWSGEAGDVCVVCWKDIYGRNSSIGVEIKASEKGFI